MKEGYQNKLSEMQMKTINCVHFT